MAAPQREVPPPRSPEREALAQAILCHAEAKDRAERVAQAQQRLHDDLFARLLPNAEQAEEALAAATARAPAEVMEAVLAGRGVVDASPVIAAEDALRRAQAEVAQARQADPLLDAEARRSAVASAEALRIFENAASSVVSSDLSRAALVAELYRSSSRTLQIARALRTSGMRVQEVGRRYGLVLLAEDEPAAIGVAALFMPDAEWLAALAALRRDPDAALPGLPEPEPPVVHQFDCNKTSPTSVSPVTLAD